MKRFSLLISFFLFAFVAVAQVQTVSKADVAKLKNRIVEITAVAIPYDQAGSVVIDSSTYHKVTGSIYEDNKTVRVTASAQRADAGIKTTMKKEEIQQNQTGTDRALAPGQKMVEVRATATKR